MTEYADLGHRADSGIIHVSDTEEFANHMVGLRRRRKIEGWAVDVAETDSDVGRSTLLQRFADSNRLWVICLAVVVALGVFLAKHADNEGPANDRYLRAPTAARGSHDDARHRAFSAQFVSSGRGRTRVLEARFVSLESFRIVVPANMGKDDVEFITKLAGLKIVNKFHYRPVIQTYAKGVGASVTLVATAHWEAGKYGFVVKTPNARRK